MLTISECFGFLRYTSISFGFLKMLSISECSGLDFPQMLTILDYFGLVFYVYNIRIFWFGFPEIYNIRISMMFISMVHTSTVIIVAVVVMIMINFQIGKVGWSE